MCFGGGSSAQAPLTTPSVSPADAYTQVTTSSIPSSQAPASTTGTGSTIATTSPYQKSSGSGLTGM